MTAPILGMPPTQGQVIAVIRSYEDLIEALRTMKAIHGLSNTWCDEIGGLTSGHTDKLLGPASAKKLSPMTMDVFFQMFAIEFEMKIDIEQAKRMQDRWERRTEARVAAHKSKVGAVLLERAKPHVIRDFASSGGVARASKLASTLRSEISRKAGKRRMKGVTKEQRSAMNLKGWETRRKAMPNKPHPGDPISLK